MFLKYLDLSSACRNDAIHPKVVTRRREKKKGEKKEKKKKKKKRKKENLVATRHQFSPIVMTSYPSTKDPNVFYDDKISLR